MKRINTDTFLGRLGWLLDYVSSRIFTDRRSTRMTQIVRIYADFFFMGFRYVDWTDIFQNDLVLIVEMKIAFHKHQKISPILFY